MISLLLLAVGLQSAPQDTTQSVFTRLVFRRFEQLAQDSAVRRATGAINGLTLAQKVLTSAPRTYSDPANARLIQALAATVSNASEPVCSRMLHTPLDAAQFTALAAPLDSTGVVPWVEVFADMVWAIVRPAPTGRIATLAEWRASLVRMEAEATPRVRAALSRVRRGGEAARDRCTVVRAGLLWLANMPAQESGPFMRLLFDSDVPFNPAA